MNNDLILQLSTSPGSDLELSKESGLTKFKKELLKAGVYIHGTTKQIFAVTKDQLNQYAKTFGLYLSNGNKVGIPTSHKTKYDAMSNQGWVTKMFVEGDSLYGILELKDAELALTSDVSVGIPDTLVDGRGIKYDSPITHVALCSNPVIPGLESFEKLELSLGDSNMDFLKSICAKLGLTGDKATEAGAVTAIDSLQKPAKPAKPDKLELSNVPDTGSVAIAKLVSDNRALKLSGLLKAGLITPALKDIIEAKYVDPEACTLELSRDNPDDAFEFLFDVLAKHKTVELDEKTGPQSLELSNASTGKKNVIAADVDKRRAAAGMKD